MVKGMARRVIVVKSPDPDLFEQAIFLLREDAPREGPPEEQVLQCAQEVADAYLLRVSPRGRRCRFLPPLLFALGGALLASALWLLAPGFPLPF